MNAPDFIRQQLATTGWAPTHLEAAQMLCPEVARDFKTFNAWQQSPACLLRAFPGAALYKAQVPGLGEILVLSRNAVFLAERMAWILGLEVTNLVEIITSTTRPSIVPKPGGITTSDNLGQPEQGGAIEKAKALVADMLKAGTQPAAEVISAGQGASISERTIQRAAEQLGVAKSKDGNGGWAWKMP